MNKHNKETLVNLISNILSFVISVMIGFFLSPYIIKHLGAEANGFAQLANNFITYASLITLALNSMAGRFMSIEYHKGNIVEVTKYYSSLIIGNIIIILFLLILGSFIVYKLEIFINIEENISDVKLLFMFMFINFIVTQISSIFSVAMYVTNKLYYHNIINAVMNIFKVCILLTLFCLFKPHMYYVGLSGLILSLLTLFLNILIKTKLLPKIIYNRKYFSTEYIIKLVASGVWNTINQCGNILMTGLDLLLANLFINPIEMGILSVAKTIPTYIIQLGNMINVNFSPGLTIIYANSNEKNILGNLRWSMKISSVLMSVPIGIFAVFGNEFYTLWVPSLDSNKLLILSLLTCMSFVPFSGPQVLYNVYTTTNNLKFNSITVVLGGLFNFIVVYILLKFTNLGVYAVAGVSSLISIMRNLIITVPYTAKLLRLKWYEFYKDVGVSSICCFIVIGISVLVRHCIACNGWINLIVAVTISCFFSIVAESVILLNQQERIKLFNKLLKRS